MKNHDENTHGEKIKSAGLIKCGDHLCRGWAVDCLGWNPYPTPGMSLLDTRERTTEAIITGMWPWILLQTDWCY